MYQLMWQRMLFTMLGIDLISITIIVSVFMFGIGVGGLWGGYFADRKKNNLLWAYLIIEAAIAVFGFCSPTIMSLIEHFNFFSSHLFTLLSSFVVLSLPTLFMGATFPILVTYVDSSKLNIGNSVGGLYFSNTLGGAIGALLSGFILLNFFNLEEIVYLAAVINLIIAVTPIILLKRTPI